METSNKLLTQDVSKELLEQFMNEAKDSSSPVRQKVIAIWDILQARFKRGHPNKVKGINLEYYYLGFLNYGCNYEESGGIDLQKFDYTGKSTPEYPELSCSLASEGCHSDKDCHRRGFWCSCQGPSCVMYISAEQDTGKIKYTAKARIESYKRWKGCVWKGLPLFSKCKCINSSRALRREVWSLPSKDVVKKPNRGVSAIKIK